MNGIQFDVFRGFKPPAEQSMMTSHFFSRLMDNILTLGIHAVTETVQYRSCIHELEKEQTLFLKKYALIKEQWQEIEQRIETMLDDVLALEVKAGEIEEVKDLQTEIDQIIQAKDELDQESIEVKEESSFVSIARKIIGVIHILTQYSADFSSLGFLGCYQNHLLQNRIQVLTAQNDFLQQKIDDLKDKKQKLFEKNIDVLRQGIQSKTDLINIAQTDPAKAYFEVANLNQQLKDLEKQITSLHTQYKTAKEGEDKLSNLLQQSSETNADHTKTIQDLKQQISKLEGDRKELGNLRQQLQNAGKNSSSNDPVFNNLQKSVGLLQPKYQPTEKELEALTELKEDGKFTDAFTKRYGNFSTAPEIFRAGFAYALEEIFKMVDQGAIKLNRALGTPTSKGAQVAYRFLALDWIKGGKCVSSCLGYELHLNDKSLMLVPSAPENVLKYRTVDGKQQPTITMHFNARCDLIPGEEVLKHTPAACGIDPIAAKSLWAKLNAEERKHFLTLLLEPAVEDDSSDYMASVNFVSRLPSQRQKEIYILIDLISDIGVALEAKFKSNIAMSEWQNYLDVIDFELQPFIKKEKEDPVVVAKPIEDDSNEPLIPWQLNFETLSGTVKGVETQVDFYELISNVQEVHQVYFDHLQSSLLELPMTKGKVFNSITWDLLKRQFYTCHKMISPHGCLLSNFWAVVSVDEKELQGANIAKLKMAMAVYLDNPHIAKEFEGALRNDFQCSVDKFKAWLRGNDHFLNGAELTPTVLAIAAYTLGVRVVLFTPPSDSGDPAHTKGKVDEYGRLMPVEDIEGHYFGPPTKEVFFMAVEDDYSYYGLFPKMKLKGEDQKKLKIPSQHWDIIEDIDAYWHSIHQKI